MRLQDLLLVATDGSLPVVDSLAAGPTELGAMTNGFRAGDLWVITGRTGTGKSVLAMDFARGVAVRQGLPVLWLTRREDPVDLATRLISAESGVRLRAARLGTDERARLTRRVGELADVPLSFVTLADESEPAGVAAVLAPERPRLVVVDDLPAVLGTEATVVELHRLKQVARTVGATVVAVAQDVPRADATRRDEDLAEACDVVVRVVRDHELVGRLSPRSGEADLMITHNRRGPRGTVTVVALDHYSRFTDFG